MVDPQLADAMRRTRLANERTFLAWLRGGLTAIAVAIGAGAVVPDVVPVTRWPFVVLGIGFGVFGIALMALGMMRQRAVHRALDEMRDAPLGGGIAMAVTVFGMLLGALTIVAVLMEL